MGQNGQGEVHPLGHCVYNGVGAWLRVPWSCHPPTPSAVPMLQAPLTLPSPVFLSLKSLRNRVFSIHTAPILRALDLPSLIAGSHPPSPHG